MTPSHAASKNLIQQTRKFWQPRIRRNFTDEDARQVAENVTGFFAILAEWSRAARSVSTNDPNVGARAEAAEACHER